MQGELAPDRSSHTSEAQSTTELAAYWIAPGGVGIPELLAAAGVRESSATILPGDNAVCCFSPVEADRLGSSIAEIREAIGAEAYLVAVLDRELSAAWKIRALELGADDMLELAQDRNIALCLARAKRAFALQQMQAKRDSREREYLQNSIDNLPSPIFYKDRKGIYVGCNKAFEDYIGLTKSQVVGSSVYDVAPADLAKVYEAADEALMHDGAVQVYEAQVRYADGSLRTVSFHKAAIRNEAGEVVGLAGAMLDITDRKSLESQLLAAAERDPLTNCYNRRKFFEVAGQLVAQAEETRQPLCVAIVDIDHFKAINDRLGHASGDQALRKIAARLTKTCGKGNLMARTGGEEFFFVYPDCPSSRMRDEAERLRACVANQPLEVEGATIAATISVGAAQFRPGSEDLAETLKRADQVLYEAKAAGRNRVRVSE